MTGIITNIQSYCIHDGPGIRTVVYFKGCQLACKWCANPETQGDSKVIEGKEAPAGQQWFWGKQVEVDELVSILMKDRVFYDQSDGGVTLSGGDPLYQPEFTYELCEKLKANGIHVAIDTSGYCSWDTIRNFLPVVDLWLYDIKSMNTDKHRDFTGVTNLWPMRNLLKLSKHGANINVRIAVIPGFNNSVKDMTAISDYLKHTEIKDISLFPYHIYGMGKYERLGRKYEMPTESHPEELIRWICDYFNDCGFNAHIGY